MQKYLLSGLVLGLLAGCATQPPAPIEQGNGSSRPAAETRMAYRSAEAMSKQAVSAVESIRIEEFSEQSAQTYLVQPGDTLSQIAGHFRIPVNVLAMRNDLAVDQPLAIGQVLIIPAAEDVAEVQAIGAVSTPKPTNQEATSRFTDRVSQRTQAEQRAEVPELEPRPVLEPAETVPAQPPAAVVEKRTEEVGGYTYHQVGAGENLFRIGLRYDVSVFDLMNINNIEKPEDLQAGSMLKIPLARHQNAEQKAINVRAAQSKGMIWPVQGQLAQRFGEQARGVTFTGVAIMAEEGTPVAATADGNVIYAAGGLRAYGNLILIRHADGLITAYGHNKENLVNKGDFVRKGQIIARVGQSGNVDRPQLHFEVRRNAQAIDPLKVLPNR